MNIQNHNLSNPKMLILRSWITMKCTMKNGGIKDNRQRFVQGTLSSNSWGRKRKKFVKTWKERTKIWRRLMRSRINWGSSWSKRKDRKPLREKKRKKKPKNWLKHKQHWPLRKKNMMTMKTLKNRDVTMLIKITKTLGPRSKRWSKGTLQRI